MILKRGIGNRAFDCINYTLIFLVMLVTVYPFWHVLIASLLPYDIAIQSNFYLWPKKVTFSAYEYIFSADRFVSSLGVSVVTTVARTLYQLAMTVCAAYAFTRKDLPGKKFLMMIFILTMFFNGGIIANYIWRKQLHLLNNLLVMIIPFGVSCYNMVIIKNFFESLPSELEEAAQIDGANNFQVFFKVAIPLSVPVISTFTLFFAVDSWNEWYSAMIYMTDKSKWPFTMLLRDILIESNTEVSSNHVSSDYLLGDSIKMASIVVSVVPIMIIYPFVQKYFAKGMMVGAVKG
jgi:putative aldouronate transport system permease protein